MSMAFSNNQSYQQSPPNIRNNKNMGMHHQAHGLNQAAATHGQQQLHTMQSTHHKLNNLFDKNPQHHYLIESEKRNVFHRDTQLKH